MTLYEQWRQMAELAGEIPPTAAMAIGASILKRKRKTTKNSG